MGRITLAGLDLELWEGAQIKFSPSPCGSGLGGGGANRQGPLMFAPLPPPSKGGREYFGEQYDGQA